MAMRELVTGAAGCAVPDGGASSSNPMGAFANTLLGFAQKKQEGLRELPVARPSYPDSSVDLKPADPLGELLGPQQHHQLPDARSSEFFQSFHSAEHGMFTDAWEEANRPVFRPSPPPNLLGIQNQPSFAEMDQIFNDNIQRQPSLDGPPQRIMSNFLRSFVNSSRSGLPFQPVALPNLMLSPEDKLRIRNRSCIMARHIFADKSEDFINSQVNALLHSLDIDSDIQLNGLHPRYPELENLWNESQGAPYHQATHSADKWVTEYNRFVPRGNSESWADSFQQEHGSHNWASEFEREQKQVASAGLMGAANGSSIAAMEHSRMLAHTLSQSSDPKFQNSKFLQFVSKMSRGELIVDDNQIKQAGPNGEWADEYHQQLDGDPSAWAHQFSNQHHSGGDTWAKEFASEQVHRGPADEQWVNEFSNLHLQDWGEEFSDQMKEGILGDDSIDAWANDFMNEQPQNFTKGSDRARSVYVFSDMNPYVGHPDPLKEGQELFRKGLLSEAVLALEAEVLKNPDNAQGWRLLGVTHAENDDDQQAIAAMLRSHEADPRNLEVLLALGVSHTNEMESREALKYLFQWIQYHPKYGQLIPQEQANVSPYHADVTRLYYEAAEMSPEDVDVHVVLGVLYNLSREFDKAIPSFETSLRLKPRDYSLWNKLGATEANSGKSEDAISAYQKALDLKPNYVRAWANMGISFANKGMYEDSIRYYVRALAMNPKADSTWKYLHTSLGFASRADMIEACNSRNLDLLQKEFPL